MLSTSVLVRFGLFFLALALVMGVAGAYVHRRTSTSFELGPRARRALAILLAAGIFQMFAPRILVLALPRVAHSIPDAALAPLAVTGGVVVVAVLFSAAALLLVDLVHAIAAIPRKLTRTAAPVSPSVQAAPEPTPDPEPAAPPATARAATPSPPAVTRRLFLGQATTGSALFLGSSSSLYGALVGRHDYQLTEVAVPIPGLPRRLDGYTLVQLSDLHVGLFVGEAEMAAALDLVRRARPDRLVITGDLVDNDAGYAASLGGFVRRLGALARDGVTVIPGNHDYYAGVQTILDATAAAGASVLRNEGRIIGTPREGFALLGVDDRWGASLIGAPPPDLDAAIATVPPDLPRVLLWHNPDHFAEAAGKVALQISGHTHGGQVNPGFRPAELVLPHPWIAGSYELKGTKLYVNRGFGTAGPPARIGAPPEVTKIVLVSA
ncbi:MAG: metallophosphoesterase [Byssovorax sp.]